MDYKKIYNKDYFTGKNSLFYKFGYGNLSKYSFDNLFRPLKPFLITRKYFKVLDVGCAFGLMLERFPEKTEKYGIDISDYAIEKAKERLPRGNFSVWGAEKKFPFPQNFFDFVLCNNLLEHLEKPEQALDNIFAVLKSGGLLYVTIPNLNFIRKNFYRFLDKKEHHISMYSHRNMLKLLAERGFTVEKHWTSINFTHFFFIKFRSNFGTTSSIITRK